LSSCHLKIQKTSFGGWLNSKWYKSALQQKAGRIIAEGMTKEVAFQAVQGDKYNGY
jgi:hypothetical protein